MRETRNDVNIKRKQQFGGKNIYSPIYLVMSKKKGPFVVLQRLPISITNTLLAASQTTAKNRVPSENTPIKCDFCHRLFKLKSNRDRHVKQHTGKGRFHCKQCNATFYCSALLEGHKKTHNMQPRQCKVGYNTATALTSHMQNHKTDSPSSTSHGPLSTSNVPFFTSSVPSSTSSGPSSTSSILSSTSYARSSSSNSLSSPHAPFKCQQFSDGFATSKELQTEHKTSEHLEKSSVVWLASIAERAKAKPKKALNIQKLLRMKKEIQLAMLKSDLSIEAVKEEPLDYESVMTLQEKLSKLFGNTFEIKADDCGIKECLKPKCRSNVSESKGKETDKDNTSNRFHMKFGKVPKEYKDKKSIPKDENMRDLHSQLFECELCHKVLASRISLRRHAKLHADVKPFICEICKRGYTSKSIFKRHIKKVHENKQPFTRDHQSQPFECELCHKVLMSKKSLQRHTKIHAGVKPFVCEICKRGYTSKPVLKRHIKKVHEKSFQCQECHLCFSQKVTFQAHYKMTHF